MTILIKFLLIIGSLLLVTSYSLSAQMWADMMEDPNVNFYDVQNAFELYWNNKPYTKGSGYKQYKRWEYKMAPKVFPSGKRPIPNQAWKTYNTYQQKYRALNQQRQRTSNWSALGPFTWQNTSYNPGNGRINTVVEDPSNSNVLYVGTSGGGAWKSTDAGSTWQPLTDNFPILSVSALAVNPSNSNVVYLGTGDSESYSSYSIGVLKSNDGGQTWTPTTLETSTIENRAIRKIIIHPTNHNTIFVITTKGVYKSLDAGVTWEFTLEDNMRDIEFHPSDPSIMYATSNSFYKTTDGGDNWRKITIGLPSSGGVNRAEIAVTALNTNYIYLIAGDNSDSGFLGLYRSTNEGESFSLQSNSPNILSSSQDGTGTGGQSRYDLAIDVSPTDAEVIFVGGVNVWKSINGGASWTINAHWAYPTDPGIGYTHADIHDLIFFGNNFYCVSDGGIFKSTNQGYDWIDKSVGLSITEFYRFTNSQQDPNFIVAGTQDNGSFKFDGVDWTHILGGDGMETAINPNNNNIIYCEFQYGGLRRSTNAGNSFRNRKPDNVTGNWVTPYQLDPSNPTTIFAGYEQVMKSTDEGRNWSTISNFSNISTITHINVANANSDVIYAGTLGRLYRTDNGGQSWVNLSYNLPRAGLMDIEIHPTNPLVVWASFSGYSDGIKVFHSIDGGQNWVNISKDLPNIPANTIVYQNGSNGGLYVGMDVGIYYTDSTLNHWVPFAENLPNVSIYELEIVYIANKLRAATHGRGIWESPLYTTPTIAPIANFNFTNHLICSTDSIKFKNQSIYNNSNFEWQFPGGQPSTSSLENPTVYYATPGNYQGTLIVENAYGKDTLVQNINVEHGAFEYTLTLNFADFPEETRWEIKDILGNIILGGGNYIGKANTTVVETFCLTDGCYEIAIHDSYSDGMAPGSWSLSDGTSIIGSGGAFNEYQGKVFCVGSITGGVALQATTVTDANCGQNDGRIQINATSPAGGLRYSLYFPGNYQISNTFSGLANGSYTVYVKDATNDVQTITATINEVGVPIANASSSMVNIPLNGTIDFFSTGSQNIGQLSWDFGDGNTSTNSNPSHTFGTQGVYPVVLSVTNYACTAQDTVWVSVGQTNTTESYAIELLDILPNPIEDKFTVKVNFDQSFTGAVTIYDALGRKVFWEAVNEVMNFERNLHFGNEASGMYIITVSDGTHTLSKSFIKK